MKLPPTPANPPTGLPPPGRKWTDAQWSAIRADGRSLLVSAAAGSGKTSVLAERCAYLVCDAPEPCGVDQLLVVTFTESAATEMRDRIQKALRDRAARGGDSAGRLARQLALVEHAHVSTVHGFCARLLRQNFNLAGVDPHFHVIDADEAALMRLEVARDVFDRRYESDDAAAFHALLDGYADGRDEPLVDQVIHTHELLTSLIDPGDWLDRALARVSDAADKPLDESDLGRELLTAVDTALNRLERRCADAAAALKPLGINGYTARVTEWAALVLGWIDTFARHGIDALAKDVKSFEPARAPSVKADTPHKDLAKALLDSLKEQMQSGPLVQLLAFTETQWRHGQRATAVPLEELLGLVREFGEAYETRKSESRGLDFADLERKALEVLRQEGEPGLAPSPVARAYHFQYRHVLVDEYQDINELQDAILTLVSRECVKDEGEYPANLFTVGDVKQSVFRFRLAEPARFLDRARRFRACMDGTGEVIDLRENFRSRLPLLEAINSVFRRLMTEEAAEIEYDDSHALRGGGDFPATDGCFKGAPIELHVLPQELTGRTTAEDGDEPAAADLERSDYEAMLCARRIRALTGAGGSEPVCVCGRDGTTRAADFGDVAILLRSLRFKADVFAEVLRKNGIPVHAEGGAGFFEAPEIRDVVALLNVLDNQQQDVPLAAVLRSPLAALPEPETSLARVRLAYPPAAAPFHQAVVRYATDHDDELAARLRDFLAQLSGWRDQARKRPLAEVLWQVYDQTGYLAFCGGLEDGRQRVANLLQLHERSQKFASFHGQGLHRFIFFLNTLRDEKEIGRPSLAGENERAVRIMSIHRSKGLEFPVVILPDLGKRFNLSDARGPILVDRKAGLGLSVVDEDRQIRYPSLASTLVKTALHRQTLAEEMRLLYVAMTRAKEHLILIGTAAESTPEKWAGTWKGHKGPLPPDEVLGAASVLDWLGPVHAASGGVGADVLQLFPHRVEEARQWPNPRAPRPAFDERQRAMAALRPLAPPPPVTPEAAEVIRRFETPYRHEPFTKLEAVKAATAASPDAPARSTLPLPRFFSDEHAPSAAGVGTATHVALQHLDYARPCDAADVAAQIDGMVRRQYLTDAQAAVIDQPSLAWLAASEVGVLLRDNAAGPRREIDFAVAEQTIPSADPADAVMARGRIDLLVPTGGGLAVVDFKTDRVTPAGVVARSAAYEPQWRAYAEAVERVTGLRVTDVYLVFLAPRVIVKPAWRAGRP